MSCCQQTEAFSVTVLTVWETRCKNFSFREILFAHDAAEIHNFLIDLAVWVQTSLTEILAFL